ncbi:MAG: hypothetical protein ACREXW_07885 [Gammaproteobacteria bacterium]
MKSMWEEFGFTQTPYRVTPLEANAADFDLFTSRDREGDKFQTMMDSSEGAFVVVSGDIGIGKTSFVNIQQHVLGADMAGWGQKLAPCLRITPLTIADDPTLLARRIVHDAVQNIEYYCARNVIRVPRTCETIRDWLSFRASPSGYQLTLGLLGVGQNWSLPPVGDATLETWRDVLEAMAGEVRKEMRVSGFIVCLDNAETLTQSQLTSVLMSYRDTLFSIKGIWWVLIGQSRLYEQIDAIDRRVSQRISGNGVELSHLDVQQFQDAIERRVRAYRNREDAVSPLSMKLHDLLFQAACGEVRFVFDTANTLVTEIVTSVRASAKSELVGLASSTVLERALTAALKELLIDRQIPDDLAITTLKKITTDATADIRKSPRTVELLQLIGEDAVTKGDYGRFSFGSPGEFLTDYLEPLHARGVLGCPPREGEPSYRLKGFAWLLRKLEMLR